MVNSRGVSLTVVGCILHSISLAVAGVIADGKEVFSEDIGYCQVSRSVLFCDFEWKLESVYLKEYPTCANGKCKAITLQRIHNFYFDNSLCVDLTLKHMSKVNLIGNTPRNCSNMGLSIQNVTLDFIDDGMTSVYADESRIKNLSFGTKAGHLTVIGSQVDVFSIKDVVVDDASFKIHSTKIKDFKRLRISGKGRLHLLDSIVEDFPPESLILDSSKMNLISGVTFTKFDEDSPASILLSNGSDITLEEVKGAVKISSPKCPVIASDWYPSAPPIIVTEDLQKPPEGAWNGYQLEHTDGCSSYSWMVTAITLAVTVILFQTCVLIYLLLMNNKIGSQRALGESLRDSELPLTSASKKGYREDTLIK